MLEILVKINTQGVLLRIFKRINIKNTRIFLIYNKSAFLLKKAFVFNLKFYFNNKLKITNIIYYF